MEERERAAGRPASPRMASPGVALALRYAGRQVPRDVLLAAWPGETRLIERLLGPPPDRPPG